MKGGSRSKPSLPLTVLDRICDRFETACKAAGTSGPLPSPETFLEEAPESSWLELLRELSKREFAYRKRRMKLSMKLRELSAGLAPLTFLELVGRGGMGEVYKARDERGEFLAVKLLPREFAKDQERVTRFEREAEILTRIKHKNIVALRPNRHGADRPSYLMERRGLRPYFVMEYAEGGNLRDRIGEDGLVLADAIDVMLRVCEGLKQAHEARVIHRDIKPENILIDGRGEVKIADFGLAKTAGSVQTKTSQVMGTPGYMAPEQLLATRKVDCRADIYSLGVVFCEALTGQRPDDRAPGQPHGLDDFEKWLQDIVLRTLESDPDDRFQTIDEVIGAIRTGLTPVAQPSVVRPPTCADSGSSKTTPFAIGTAVECRWKRGPAFFKGTIAELDGNRVFVHYDDGDKEWATIDLIRLAPQFALGTPVDCRWKGGERYYSGRITGIEGNRIHIDYDDGDNEWTTADMIKR